MQIAAQQAIIKTASVEIKSLTVSGKQVTLAVFRQLDARPLLDYQTRNLNGVPWGRVNYHPDKCADDAEHLHVIWQEDSYIYRDVIYINCGSSRLANSESYMRHIFNIEDWSWQLLQKQDHYLLSCIWHDQVLVIKEGVQTFYVTPQLRFPGSYKISISDTSLAGFPSERWNNEKREYEQSPLDARREWAKTHGFDDSMPDPDLAWRIFVEARQDLEMIQGEVVKSTAFHRKQYDSLQDLDLLFIAV